MKEIILRVRVTFVVVADFVKDSSLIVKLLKMIKMKIFSSYACNSLKMTNINIII